MPTYHSRFNAVNFPNKAMGIPVIDIKSKKPCLDTSKLNSDLKDGSFDIIDEAILYFRSNVLFKNFNIEGDADKLLVYITVFIQKCLEKANLPDDKKAKEVMNSLVDGCQYFPNVENFFNTIVNMKEKSQLKDLQVFLRNVRKEVVSRLIHLLWEDPQTSMDRKYWIAFGKKRFLGYEMMTSKQ